MKILVYMGHPAHFYLYKNAIINWRKHGHRVDILIKKKDILQQLLDNQGWEYHNILQEGRKNNKLGMAIGMLKRTWREWRLCRKLHPDILIGTSVENSFIGKLTHIPVINCNEDDAAVVPLYAKLSYPWADVILNPIVCNSGKWDTKAIKYPSYQKLAYLHPKRFTPSRQVVEQYGIDTQKPYFLLRFALLKAHHDAGVHGINTEVAQHIIDMLQPYGNVYITSERQLESQFERYRLHINPLDMHCVLAFAAIYIGDSQSMAVEAAMLGVPSFRFNDFVGNKKIGVLEELEHVYGLTCGVSSHNPELLYEKVNEVLVSENCAHELFQARRQQMLNEKIDYTQFLIWFVENYPESKMIATQHYKELGFWNNFK